MYSELDNLIKGKLYEVRSLNSVGHRCIKEVACKWSYTWT